LPPPTFYSIDLYINYITPHLLFTLLFTLYPDVLNPRFLDTFLFPLDALLRTNTITATIGLLSNSGVNPVYASSPLAHMLLGAIASAGGGLSAATLKTWTPEWSLGTPPVLKEGAGIWGTVDVWGGALVGKLWLFLHVYTSLITFHSPCLWHCNITPCLLGFRRRARVRTRHYSVQSIGRKGVGCCTFDCLIWIARFLCSLDWPGHKKWAEESKNTIGDCVYLHLDVGIPDLCIWNVLLLLFAATDVQSER